MLEVEHQNFDEPLFLELDSQKDHKTPSEEGWSILYQDPKRFLRLQILDRLYMSLPAHIRGDRSDFYDVVFYRILNNKTKDGRDFTADFFVSNIIAIINKFKKDLKYEPEEAFSILDNYSEKENAFCNLCQKQDRFFDNVAVLERIKKEKLLDKQFLQETRSSLVSLYTALKDTNEDFKRLSFERTNLLQKRESRLLYYTYRKNFDICSF